MVGIALVSIACLVGCQTGSGTSNVGDTAFIAYEGKQVRWPTSPSAMVEKDFELPVYRGLPAKPYEVLGRVIGTQRNVIGRGLALGLWSDRARLKDVCTQARLRGADAVLLTNDAELAERLKVPRGEARELESPLYDFDGAVVAIRWINP